MYIYELPFEVNKELCRLLDIEEYWKELAGNQMQYSPFDIIEIEQAAHRYSNSPTHQLFTRWGQLNHRVEELYILLYKMKHVPALQCLGPIVDKQYHRLLNKLLMKNRNGSNDENGNIKTTHIAQSSGDSIPIPVMLIEQGSQSKASTNNRITTESGNGISSSRNSTSTTNGQHKDVDDEIIRNVASIPKMDYDELKEATDNWSKANLLGKGGFGEVYKGEWKHTPVAVKCLKDNDDRFKELIRELGLNQYRHPNILPLYGYSLGGKEACLVYQLMAGGSLEQRLKRKTIHPPLTWPQRYWIAHGIARGLQYLHNMAGTPLIHGDIKPANILLDQCSMPKIGDFGLARKGPPEDRTHLKVSRVFGTRPYLPVEYQRSNVLSAAVDVFSYGVVSLELATALPPYEKTRVFGTRPYLPVEYQRSNVLSAAVDVFSYGVVSLELATALPPYEKTRFPLLLSPYIAASIKTLEESGKDPIKSLEDPILRDTEQSNPYLCNQFIEIGLHCTKDKRTQRPAMLDVYKLLDLLEFPGKHFF